MQALKSLFSRVQTQAAVVPAMTQPTPLSAESLKLVGGGLPRVSAEAITFEEAAVQADRLPRVS